MKANMIIAAALTALLAGCGTAAAGHSHTQLTKATPAATPASCLDQATAWRTTALPMISKVVADLSASGQTGLSGNLGSLQGASATLSTDSTALLADPAPACIPGLSTDLTTALNDFVAANASISQGTIGGIQDATTQVTAGSAAISRATSDLTSWSATNG